MLFQRLHLKLMPTCLRCITPISQFSSRERGTTETYYEVLKLETSCSPKQIRDAFIKLSKECHPDRNKNDPSTHNRFVRINEAYNILIKPQTRKEYDYILSQKNRVHQHRVHVQEEPYDQKPFQDPSFYENRDRSKDAYYESEPYYGFRGLNRVSNSTIVIVLIIFTIFGVGIQALAIVKSHTFRRDEMLQKSQMYAENLRAVKERAEEYGTLERQIEEFQKRATSDTS